MNENLQLDSDFTNEQYRPTDEFVAIPTAPTGAAVTSINGLGGPTVTLGGGTTGLSFSTAAPNVNLSGTLVVAHGGTGLSSAPGRGQALLGNGTGYVLTTVEFLLSTTTVNLNSTANQDLYTVPAGKALVVTRAVMRNASTDLSSLAGAVVNIFDSATTADVITGPDPSLLSSSALALTSLPSGGAFNVVTATNKARFVIDTAFGSTATAAVDLFGYLI